MPRWSDLGRWFSRMFLPAPYPDERTRVELMLSRATELERYAAMDFQTFNRRETREEAQALLLGLGRTAAGLPPRFRREHPEVDWDTIQGLRTDTVIHSGLDYAIMWSGIQEHVPEITMQLRVLRRQLIVQQMRAGSAE